MQTRNIALFPLVLLISGCVADDLSMDELPRNSPAEITTEESLIPESSSVDDDEIEIVYSEASESLEILVNVEKFARTAPGSTVEMQIAVTTADGVTTRHDLNWTSGGLQEIPRIEAPVLQDGLYEVVVTELVVDGRVQDRPLTRQRMDVRGDLDLYSSPHDDDDDGGWEDDDDDGGDWDDDDDDGGHDGGGHGGKKCKEGKDKHGSNYDDKLRGTERNDTLYGRDGKDKLWGYECHDRLYGGNGRDTLRGGQGDDFLDGGKGEDSCIGGKGKDKFRSCEYIEH